MWEFFDLSTELHFKHNLLALNLNLNLQKQDDLSIGVVLHCVYIVENITKSFYSFSLGLPKVKKRVAK